MMLSPQRPTVSQAYRFVTRVTGRALPAVDKALRIRCTLNAADHSTVGVSVVVVRLDGTADCDQLVELLHDPGADDAAPPRYFELIVSLAPAAEPAARLRIASASGGSNDGTEYRIAGMLDPGQRRIMLPDITLRGV